MSVCLLPLSNRSIAFLSNNGVQAHPSNLMRKKIAETSDTAGHRDPVFETELVEKVSDKLGVPLSEPRGLSTRNRRSQLEAFKKT